MAEVSFLKDAIAKIESMGYPHFYRDAEKDRLYYDRGTRYELIEHPVYRPAELKLHSLDAVVEVVKHELDSTSVIGENGYAYRPDLHFYISVPSPTCVEVFTAPCRDLHLARIKLCYADATDVPGFRDTTYSYEEAMVALRSRFQPSEDQAYVLDLMSHLVSGQEITTADDGISQQVKVKTGIQMFGVTATKPIVRLRPYRTFQEVEQPASDFLIRLDDNRNLTIREADGGMWRLKARETVAAWLTEQLKDLVDQDQVTVML